jgi:hypothetical protein
MISNSLIDSIFGSDRADSDMITKLPAAKADYESSPKDACQDDTRVEIRKNIRTTLNSKQQRFVWLRGSPGTGKTAIAKSISAELKDGLWHHSFSIRAVIVRKRRPWINSSPLSPAKSPPLAHMLAQRLRQSSLAMA